MTALGRLTWLEAKLLAREPFALIFTLGFPLVLLVVLTGSFQPGDPSFGTADPSDYYLASYVGVVIGALGLVVLPAHVAAYRERGVLRRLRASSIPPWAVVGAQLGVGLAMATAGAVVLTVVGVVAFGAAAPASAPAVLGAFVLAGAPRQLAWKSSTGLPAGSSIRICRPPLPTTMSLRRRTPVLRRRSSSAARSSTASWMRFHPPGSGRRPSGMGWEAPPGPAAALSSSRRLSRLTAAKPGEASSSTSKPRWEV